VLKNVSAMAQKMDELKLIFEMEGKSSTWRKLERRDSKILIKFCIRSLCWNNSHSYNLAKISELNQEFQLCAKSHNNSYMNQQKKYFGTDSHVEYRLELK
jgi:hypothetical protein